MKRLLIAGLCLALPLASCMTVSTRQGNVLKPENIAQVHKNDSRFKVESILGTPVLRDDMHPNRAIYVDEYNNPGTGEHYRRRLEIIYNQSGRVHSIRRFGFDSPESNGSE